MNTIILVGILSALLAAPAAAIPAPYSVTSTADDATAGTLRTAVTDSNAAGGANTISWAPGGEGTISFLTGLPAVNANTTLDVTAAVSSVTLLGPGTISLTGQTTFKNGNALQGWLIGSGIVGAGSLTKTGAGTLTLSGSNSYGGGTLLKEGTLSVNSTLGSGPLTFDGGTLQSPYTFVIGSSVTLNAGNGTFDLQGGTLTLSGVIGGAGKLILNSTGTLVATAANTHSGGTEVHNGVLNVNGDAALGAPSAGVTLFGGTLQTTTDIATARSIVLNGGGRLDTNGRTLRASGVISGTGGLTKLGQGMLALSGANTYSGATLVNEGTLRLDANNALPVATDLTLAAGTVLDMSGRTQAVASFTGAGKTRMTLQTGVTNLAVAGNANFTGGALEVTASDPLVTVGQTFKPITYGSRTGASQLTILSPAAISYTPTYDDILGKLTLTVGFVPFATVAANDNQASVGRALEPLRAAPSGDMSTVLSNLYTLDATRLQAALDQIGPVSLGAMRGMGMTAASVHAASLGRRMTLLADGRGRLPSYAVKGPAYPGTLSAAGPGDTENWARSTGRALAQPWSIYMSGVGTTGKLQEANSGSGLQPGYSFNTGGFVGGADYRVGDHLAAGFSLGYLRGHASLYSPASGTVENHSLRYGVYAARFGDGFRANLYLGGASDFFSTRRGVAFGNLSRTATANAGGNEFNLDASVGYDWRTSQWGIFSPYAGLDYDRLMIGSFRETGADSLNLSVDGQTAQSLRSSLGLRYSEDFNTDFMLATPYMSAGWRHEFQRQTQPITAQLASGATRAFSVASGDFARDGTLLGAGLVLNRGREIEIKLDYLGDFRSHYVESAYNASLRFKF